MEQRHRRWWPGGRDRRDREGRKDQKSALAHVATEYLGMLLALGALVAFFGASTSHFFEVGTFRTIANQIPYAVIVSVGMTYVLIVGGIDLSVGSVLALGGAVFGTCMTRFELGVLPAVLACLLVGVACGAINGALTVAWRLPSFIVTLGMLEIARGGAYLVTESRTQYVGPAIEWIAESSVFGLSMPFILAIVIAIAAQVVLGCTRFGRYMVAVGANEQAAYLSGIHPRRVKFMVFVLCGLLASVGGVIETARLGSADPNAGVGFELQAIAAVVIGGTSLMGGRGSVIRSFLGVLIIAVLGAGLAQLGAQEHTKRLITGCVIIAAVVLDYYRRRMSGTP